MIFLCFVHQFGPYKALHNLKLQIKEIIQITLETEGDEEIDEIRKRYEQLNFDSYSLY